MRKFFLLCAAAFLLSGCVSDGDLKTELTFSRDGKPYQPALRSDTGRLECIVKAKLDLTQNGYARIVKLWEAASKPVKDAIDEYSGCKYELNPDEFNQTPLMLSQAVMLLGSDGKTLGKFFFSRGAMYRELGENFIFVTKDKDYAVKLHRDTGVVEEIASNYYDDPLVNLTAKLYGKPDAKKLPNDAYSILGKLNTARISLDFYLKQFDAKKTKLISWDASRLLQTIIFSEIYFNYFQTKLPAEFAKFSADNSVKTFLRFQLTDGEALLKKADVQIKASENGKMIQERAKLAVGNIGKLFKL